MPFDASRNTASWCSRRLPREANFRIGEPGLAQDVHFRRGTLEGASEGTAIAAAVCVDDELDPPKSKLAHPHPDASGTSNASRRSRRIAPTLRLVGALGGFQEDGELVQ